MHNRIHPIFAESFLESLDGLPATHPMNDKHLVTRLEIVLALAGCGKKGNPQPPPDVPNTYPRTYPSE